MGLPWRFISASAGIVTLVMEGSSGEELVLPGKFVRLMLSPVPLRQPRMRPEQLKYTPTPAVIKLAMTWTCEGVIGRRFKPERSGAEREANPPGTCGWVRQ